jgi:thiazole synthase ThiGH ThiG subunit
MLVSINDGTVDIANQMTGERTLLPDAIELVRAAGRLADHGFVLLTYTNDYPGWEMIVEQANSSGAFQKLRLCGRGGERT